MCPVVLGTQGIKQQGFRLPVLRVAVPVSACTGVGWGTASACSEHYVVATCMRVSLAAWCLQCDLLRADFFARPPALPVPWYSPGAAQWMCLFGKIWTSAPCRRRGVWHAAGRISAGDLSAVCRHSRSKGSCVCLRACSRPAKRDARVRAPHVCVCERLHMSAWTCLCDCLDCLTARGVVCSQLHLLVIAGSGSGARPSQVKKRGAFRLFSPVAPCNMYIGVGFGSAR